jgi:hypothetical protein
MKLNFRSISNHCITKLTEDDYKKQPEHVAVVSCICALVKFVVQFVENITYLLFRLFVFSFYSLPL